MKKLSLALVAITALTLTFSDVVAQSRKFGGSRRGFRSGGSARVDKFPRPMNYWTFGVNAGYANYFGDLSPSSDRFSTAFTPNPALGVFAGYRLSPYISAQGNITWIRVSGDDNVVSTGTTSGYGRYVRNLSFENNMIEFQGLVQFDLFPHSRVSRRRLPIYPYAFTGLGVTLSSPYSKGPTGTKWEGANVSLRELKTSGSDYAPVFVSLPLGIGIRYKINTNFDVGAEISYRFAFSDAIDDVVGGGYADPTKLPSELARRMANRTAEPRGAYTNKTRTVFGLDLGQTATFQKIESFNYSEAEYGTAIVSNGYGAAGTVGYDFIRDQNDLLRLIDLHRQGLASGLGGTAIDANTQIGSPYQVNRIANESGQSEYYVRGWEPNGSPRGGAAADHYITYTLKVSYLLDNGRRGSTGPRRR